MTPQRWSRIRELFGTALETPESERSQFLEAACGEDTDLRAEVEQLLAGNQERSWQSPVATLLPAAVGFVPGDSVAHYRIDARLGEGGMGVVYRGYDTRLYREVALKVLPPNRLADPAYKQRLLREARAASALNHPNIVTVYEIGSGRGVDFIAMEYVKGRSLAQAIPPAGLSLAHALDYAIQISAALANAHSAGVIHRDLKPANIMLTGEGKIKLLDFGLAKMEHRVTDEEQATITEKGALLGTVQYMSPEQAQGKETDARSDIFSFGLVLYEMITGNRAFQGSNVASIIAAILRDEPIPMDAPSKLSAIVTRCLRKLPAGRFQTMNEVHAALEQTATPGGDTPSIAVLPFANLSADKENEYFSDGLAEEILNLLTKIPGLKVTARTSSFAFRGKEQDITKIAEALRVRTILEGSVRRAGSRIRVTAQLINAADGYHLWSERYDRDMTDIFTIQDEIGQAISEALTLRLAPRAQTMNIEAYQHYLKGQYHRARYTAESLAKAMDCFEQALAIDSKYAQAYSGLAGSYYALAVLGMKPPGDVAPLAKSAAEKALTIDPADSDAHSVLATVAAFFDYDWKAAEMHFRKAMAAEPVPPLVRYRYAEYYLLPWRRVAEGIEQGRLGLETDPLSMILHWGLAWFMHQAKQYRESIEYARRALEIDANFYLIWFVMGLAQLGARFTQESVTSLKRVVELAPWWHMGVGSLAAAYYQNGDHDRSQEWARKLADSHRHTFGAAIYYAAAGRVDAMFEALEGAHRQRDLFLLYIQNQTLFEPYRTDPRYQALLQLMNMA